MNPTQELVLWLAYAPTLLWPFALAVALIGYWRRRGEDPAAAVDAPT